MSPRLRVAAIALALPALFAASVALHGQLETHHPQFRPRPNDAFYLPRGELLRATSLGFHQLAADLLWVRVVQAVGDFETRDEGFKFLHEYVDLVTDVDPKYAPPYFIASHWLVAWQQIDEAIAMLEKGRERFRGQDLDDYYKFPYYIGLDYFLWKRDRAKAVQYFREAAAVKTGPRGPSALAERLEAAAAGETNGTSYGDILAEFGAGIRDPGERAAIEPLIRHGQFYDLVAVLNPIVERYREQHGEWPEGLETLVEIGWLSRLPVDPYIALDMPGQRAGLYVDDQGKVRSRRRPAYWWDSTLGSGEDAPT